MEGRGRSIFPRDETYADVSSLNKRVTFTTTALSSRHSVYPLGGDIPCLRRRSNRIDGRKSDDTIVALTTYGLGTEFVLTLTEFRDGRISLITVPKHPLFPSPCKGNFGTDNPRNFYLIVKSLNKSRNPSLRLSVYDIQTRTIESRFRHRNSS